MRTGAAVAGLAHRENPPHDILAHSRPAHAPANDMATRELGEERLSEAYSIIDNTPDMEETVTKLRDLLGVDHLVYHSSKLGASPSADPYIRLTYPATW